MRYHDPVMSAVKRLNDPAFIEMPRFRSSLMDSGPWFTKSFLMYIRKLLIKLKLS